MVNTLLVYDDSDADLGDFFKDCYSFTNSVLLKDVDSSVHSIDGRTLSEVSISIKTNALNMNPFIFISYTHGSETELLKNGLSPFVSTNCNHNFFVNSFSYCFACYAGKQLGKVLVENGAKCFVGYSKSVQIQIYFSFKAHFIECATQGIISFFNGKTVLESINDMKNKYTSKIDEFYETDMLTASLFLNNRDAIIYHGDTKLTKSDFILKK